MKKRKADGTVKLDSPGVDRLGGLPDDVIGRILGFLPTPLAVRASQLSRRWRRLWPAHVLALNLSVEDCTNRGVGVTFPDLCTEALATVRLPARTPPLHEFLSSCCPRLRRLRLCRVRGAGEAVRALVLRSDALEALVLIQRRRVLPSSGVPFPSHCTLHSY